MATHSSTVALGIPWVEEPGGLQFIGRGCWERCPEPREQLWGRPLVGGLRCQAYLMFLSIGDRDLGLHSILTQGVRPHLEGKQRTPLSSRVATGISWSPLLAWRILWTEEHGGLQSIGLQGPVGHSVGSKRYPSRLERRVESFASPRDEA